MAVENKNEKEGMASSFPSRIRMLRLVSQIAFFFILNGVIFGLSKIPFPAPISLPAGSPFATVFGGLDAIQYILSIGNFPFLAFGVFFITGATIGRMSCGWVCPVGLWQDILAALPFSKVRLSKPENKGAQFFGQVFLFMALFLTIIVGGRRARGQNLVPELFTSIPYGVVDPAGTIFVTWFYAFFWNILPVASDSSLTDIADTVGGLFIIKSLIVFFIGAISLKVPRAYCRWICPTGALLAFPSKYSIVTVKRNPIKCVDGCNKCETVCPMQVPILDESPEGISNSLCINCGDCIGVCPDALSFGLRF